MDKKKFETLVEDALEELPQAFKEKLDNVTVMVEDRPSREVYERTGSSPYSLIFGLYHGVPYKHRGPFYGNLPPDVIVIYQDPIERVCVSEEEIRNKVLEVVKHEIGHYFGMKDPELKEIEESQRARKRR
ncbi:MAG: metallopeptidase family protein [Candidatus Aminicenantes bacterium]|jgi:predicted Zn-dependent protease with MMP-like domain